MAVINMNKLFDSLQKYIDTKISSLDTDLKELFDEYGVKELQPYLEDIEIVADNIDNVNNTGSNIDSVNTVADNIDEIIKAPQHIEEMEQLRDETALSAQNAKDSETLASKWAEEEYNVPIKDEQGNVIGYSSFHWSEVSRLYSQNLRFRGSWSPNDGSYPSDDIRHGDYWFVEETGYFDNIFWRTGDRLVYVDDNTFTGFVQVKYNFYWN